jgi:hypothetical protein
MWGALDVPSKSYLSAKVVSSFPSTYFLLPDKFTFFDRNGQMDELNLYDPSLWLENKWGFLADHPGSRAYDKLKEKLALAGEFYQKLHSKNNLRPSANQSSRWSKINWQIHSAYGVPTNDIGVYISSKEKIRFAFTKDQQKKSGIRNLFDTEVDGDGTLSRQTQRPPDWFENFGWKEYPHQAGHLQIIRDPGFIDWAAFLEN